MYILLLKLLTTKNSFFLPTFRIPTTVPLPLQYVHTYVCMCRGKVQAVCLHGRLTSDAWVTHASALSSRMMYKVCFMLCNFWNVVMGAFRP